MNFKHPLFNPANWTDDQRVSAGIIAVLLVLGTGVLVGAFALPLALWIISFVLLLVGFFLYAVAFAGFMVEFWEVRDK